MKKKTGYPEEGEIVIATVTNIQYHSVFCNLDEYDKSGMIHISEIAPGRIKSVHEYLREGKTVVVKVLRVKKDKGHIDLSLRRVTEAQKRLKANELKQQQLVENLFSQLGERLGEKPEELENRVKSELSDYPNLFEVFQAVVEDNLDLSATGLDKKLAGELTELVKDRISPRTVTIKGEFTVTTYDPEGVERIHSAFSDIPEEVRVRYAGGGRYATVVSAKDYKMAEGMLKQAIDHVKNGLGEEAVVGFERTDR